MRYEVVSFIEAEWQFPGARGREQWEVVFNGYRVSVIPFGHNFQKKEQGFGGKHGGQVDFAVGTLGMKASEQ